MYRCKEEFKTVDFRTNLPSGTVKEGWTYKLVREPIPEEKMYVLERIYPKYPSMLYMRKSGLKRHFEEVPDEEV